MCIQEERGDCVKIDHDAVSRALYDFTPSRERREKCADTLLDVTCFMLLEWGQGTGDPCRFVGAVTYVYILFDMRWVALNKGASLTLPVFYSCSRVVCTPPQTSHSEIISDWNGAMLAVVIYKRVIDSETNRKAKNSEWNGCSVHVCKLTGQERKNRKIRIFLV